MMERSFSTEDTLASRLIRMSQNMAHRNREMVMVRIAATVSQPLWPMDLKACGPT